MPSDACKVILDVLDRPDPSCNGVHTPPCPDPSLSLASMWCALGLLSGDSLAAHKTRLAVNTDAVELGEAVSHSLHPPLPSAPTAISHSCMRGGQLEPQICIIAPAQLMSAT